MNPGSDFGTGRTMLAAAIVIASTFTSPLRATPASGDRASAHAMPAHPTTELDRLEQLGRTQPAAAAAQLVTYADTLPHTDPRFLEALVEAGSQYVTEGTAEPVEQLAHRIETLTETVPLARPAAMILRARWQAVHGEPSRAERELIEAQPLLAVNPADTPPWLELRRLASWGLARGRAGHHDEALKHYDTALRLADAQPPAWRRIDLRVEMAAMLLDAMQLDKVTELANETLRLSAAAGDEYGLSRAWTDRAIVLSYGTDSAATLDAWHAALDHARLSGSQKVIVLSMANIADYYLKRGEFGTAYDMSTQALALARADHNDPAESVALANAGLALVSMKRKDEGVPLVRDSMTMDEHSGSPRNVADTVHELAVYLERAGYLADAMAAYDQSPHLSADLYHSDRQRALIELQESFANERRQNELEALAGEGRLKDEELRHHDLEIKEWTAAGLASFALLAVVAMLARRLRVRNQQLTASNEQLRQQAEIDPLTGLSNRHHLQSAMSRLPGRALEGTLYVIDVDHFKQINDRCGHAGGDAVLVEVARRLRATLRDGDLVVRWGGEEFLVLVRPLPRVEADLMAQRLLDAFAGLPVVLDGQSVGITASIGYGVFPLALGPRPADAHDEAWARLAVDWERAIAVVDSAMYLAKTHGRNGACGIARVDVAGTAGLEEAIRALESACQDGRVELVLQHGPATHGASHASLRSAARDATPVGPESRRLAPESVA